MFNFIKKEDMVVFKVLDPHDTAMEMYVNDSNQVYIGLYDDKNPEDYYRHQTIVLDKADANAMIAELQRLVKEL